MLRTGRLLGALALATTGCEAKVEDAPPADTDEACADCAKGKGGDNVWCEDCSHGFIDGEMATECKGCFEAKTGGVACKT